MLREICRRHRGRPTVDRNFVQGTAGPAVNGGHAPPFSRGIVGATRNLASIVGTIVVLGLGAACSDGNQESRPDEICATVRDRLVELELPASARDRDQRADVMRRALGSEFVDHCGRSISHVETDCVLAASDSRTAQECMAGALATTTSAKGVH